MQKRKINWGSSQRTTTCLFRINREIVRKRDEGCCIYCLERDGIVTAGTEVDHYIPQSRGGTDELSNLILTCAEHHQEKTQRESNGYVGFKERTGLDGWTIEEPDWLAVIAKRNEDYYERIGM